MTRGEKRSIEIAIVRVLDEDEAVSRVEVRKQEASSPWQAKVLRKGRWGRWVNLPPNMDWSRLGTFLIRLRPGQSEAAPRRMKRTR